MEKEFIIKEFEKTNIPIDKDQAGLFLTYMNFLLEENNKYNLTAIIKPEEIVLKHFIDSCLAIQYIDKGSSVIDIGAGAGFPSIPLAILRKDCKFTLVDSLRKRTDFLNELIKRLNLDNCEVVWSRGEDLAINPRYREQFNYCVARAVAQLNTLTEYCLPFVKIGGKMIAYKSKEVENELNQAQNAINVLGGRLKSIKKLSLEEMDRNLVIIEKISKTPGKYPRKQNKPKANPL